MLSSVGYVTSPYVMQPLDGPVYRLYVQPITALDTSRNVELSTYFVGCQIREGIL